MTIHFDSVFLHWVIIILLLFGPFIISAFRGGLGSVTAILVLVGCWGLAVVLSLGKLVNWITS